MSVLGLATTTVNVYEVTTSQDAYGANYETYRLKYSNIPVRVRQLKINYETFIDGKEMNVSQFRLYFPYQLNIIASDLIMDNTRKRKYDVVYNYKLTRKSHMQVDVKRVDPIFDTCPNVITSWNSSVIMIA